jgi:orotate phosphoribosyltransferase
MSVQIATKTTADQVASYLLQIGAIKLSKEKPFTWASGIKSPIYCDNRLSLSFTKVRTYIKEQLHAAVKEYFPGTEAIAGVATAGIPQGALIADAMQLPYLYVRSSPKGHGMENMIEGKVTPGQKVVLVEDLISTGGSSLKAAEALIAAGFEVVGMVAIFTYGFEKAVKNFEEAGISLVCLSDYAHLLPVAVTQNYIAAADLATLQQWRENPEAWMK